MKNCSSCNVSQPIDQFRKQKATADGLNPMCRGCINAYQKIWRKKNVDKVHRYSRMGRLRRLYGMTLEQYDAILEKQNGCCAICKSTLPGDNSRYFHIDHNHLTGEVRGLLCGLCNKGLGCFRDNGQLLKQATKYLEKK